ncbi:hypothetical protein [Pseudoalteromonas sp. TB41]|uniref:hypothetical protein n=1 Tax=Pseudoalteromonas sp. TB41 TaxID=985149 RepID=UPI0003FD7DF6|nr:hypothetical protein [Pseudoalteromonas sp. TB41]
MKTFEIEPKLKPDMSKYLVHMTGKDSIKSILNGGRHKGEGLILSQSPNSLKSKSFDHEIACFTETPIFALGAFVAISKRRQSEKMEYGVGFRKSYMVEHNVRPTIYVDNHILSQLFSVSDSVDSPKISKLIDSIRSLAHPLGETTTKQGFTWEREWRFVGSQGFYFDYDAIEIICCPQDEQSQLKLILGCHADRINFVDSWSQYKDFTQHIKHTDSKNKIGQSLTKHDEVEDFLENYEVHVESLKEYKKYLLSLQSNVDEIEKRLQELMQWKQYVDDHTASHCGHFSENLVYRDDFGETLCPDCSREFNEGMAKAMRDD